MEKKKKKILEVFPFFKFLAINNQHLGLLLHIAQQKNHW